MYNLHNYYYHGNSPRARWMRPLRWMMCQNKRRKRSREGHYCFYLWAVPNVYAQAMTSMKVLMIISFELLFLHLMVAICSYVRATIFMTFALHCCCIYAWEKMLKNQIAWQCYGSFSCQTLVDGGVTTLWLIVKNGGALWLLLHQIWLRRNYGLDFLKETGQVTIKPQEWKKEDMSKRLWSSAMRLVLLEYHLTFLSYVLYKNKRNRSFQKTLLHTTTALPSLTIRWHLISWPAS